MYQPDEPGGGLSMTSFIDEWSHYRRDAQRAPLLTAEHECALLRAAAKGDSSARQELIASHLRLVVDIASRHARAGLSAHDLVAEGTVGLLEALKRFDVSRETRFASYAVWWVRACVRRYALSNRRAVGMPSTRGGRIAQARLRSAERELSQRLGRAPTRAEVALALGIKEEEVEKVERALSVWDLSLSQPESTDTADDGPGPEALVAAAEAARQLHARLELALASLNARERELVFERLERDDGKTLSDMAHQYGVSRQRAGQILAHAREKLQASVPRGADSSLWG